MNKTFKAADQILTCLTDGEKSFADIVFELDFRPSTVYSNLTHLTSISAVSVDRAGKRGRYMLTDHGRKLAEALDAPVWKGPGASRAKKVYAAIVAGCETYKDLVEQTGFDRIQIATTIVNLKKSRRIVRCDPAGPTGRGGKTEARFTPCL